MLYKQLFRCRITPGLTLNGLAAKARSYKQLFRCSITPGLIPDRLAATAISYKTAVSV